MSRDLCALNSSLKRQLHVMVNLYHSRPIIAHTFLWRFYSQFACWVHAWVFSITHGFDSPVMTNYSWPENGEGYLNFRKLVFTLETHDHLWVNSLLDVVYHCLTGGIIVSGLCLKNLALQTPIKINPLNPRVTSIWFLFTISLIDQMYRSWE